MSVILTGRAVTPAHLNPAGWWRWTAQWKSHLILMNRKKSIWSLSCCLSLSHWFSCYSACWSCGTQNNCYLTHRQASKPPNTHTYSERLPEIRVHGAIQTHDSRVYSRWCVFCKIGWFGGFLPSFHVNKRQLAHVIHLNTHTHKRTSRRSSSTNPDRQANLESIVYANLNVKRVKSRGFQAGYNHTYCCFVLV